jgi:hypothetical protein
LPNSQEQELPEEEQEEDSDSEEEESKEEDLYLNSQNRKKNIQKYDNQPP